MCCNTACPKLSKSKVSVFSHFCIILDVCRCSHSLPFFVDRFINERIESVVVNKTKVNKGVAAAQEASHTKADEIQISSDDFFKSSDPSVTGVELVQLRNGQSKNAESSAENNARDNITKDPLLSIDARPCRTWNSMPANSLTNDNLGLQRHRSGGEWGDILDVISHRKTQALAPEHFENMWTKGKNYKKKDGENQSNEHVSQHSQVGKLSMVDHMKEISGPNERDTNSKLMLPPKGRHINSGHNSQFSVENTSIHADKNGSTSVTSYKDDKSVTSYKDDEHSHIYGQMSDSASSTSYSFSLHCDCQNFQVGDEHKKQPGFYYFFHPKP